LKGGPSQVAAAMNMTLVLAVSVAARPVLKKRTKSRSSHNLW
jgi:hypothetical protein